MLTNLLPGLREIRAPLISGYLWLVFFFLAFHGDLPTRNDAHPALKPLFDLGHDLSALGIATVSGVTAYLVGSAIQELLKLLAGVPPGPPLYAEPGTHLSGAGRSDVAQAVRLRVQAIQRKLFQVALSPGERGVDIEPTPAMVKRELPLIRTLLLGDHPDLVGELDRLQAEADLRITVAVPIAAFAFLFTLEISLAWLLALVPAGLLFAQGYQRQIEVGDLLAKALRIGKVDAPCLESLAASASAAIERTELEEDLAKKAKGESSPMAAFRLGNLQATGENFEAAITSLRFAADNGVIHAYAEMGLVYERLGELDDAERVYRDGEKRKDQRAAERLADLLERQEREEEALETVRRAQEQTVGAERKEQLERRVPSEGSRIIDYSKRVEQGDAKAALNLGLLRQRRGEWNDAIEAFERATTLDSADAQAWLSLGYALREVRHGEKSAAAYEEALAILERTVGGEHLEVASALMGLGNSKIELREFGDAKALFERALGIQEKEMGRDSLDVGVTLGNLGLSLVGLGEFLAARELEEESLAIKERHLPVEHPALAISLQHLGLIHLNTGDYLASRGLLERAAAIHEKSPGTNGNDLAITLENLANVFDVIGEYSKASSLHGRALEIKRKGLGEKHVSVALSLSGLGVSLSGLGDHRRALEMHDLALGILESGDGWMVEVAEAVIGRAATLRHLGRAADARREAERALGLLEDDPTGDDLSKGRALVEIGSALNAQGNFPRARGALEEGRDLLEKAVGSNHLYEVPAYLGLAVSMRGLGNWKTAERCIQTVLTILDHASVRHQPARAEGLRELAEILHRSGHLEEAKESILQAIDIQEKLFGDSHQELVSSLEVLASILETGRESEEVAAVRNRADKIRGADDAPRDHH